MSLETDLQARLAAIVGASVPVQQNYASNDQTQPRVWYQNQSGNTDLLLSGAGVASVETRYSVEVAGLDPDATASIRDAIVAPAFDEAGASTGLNGFRGPLNGWGSTRVLGIFVEDAADDYEPRALDLDDGYHIFAFTLRILT